MNFANIQDWMDHYSDDEEDTYVAKKNPRLPKYDEDTLHGDPWGEDEHES